MAVHQRYSRRSVDSSNVQSLRPAVYKRESLLREAHRELRMLVRYRDLVRHLVRRTLAKESTGRIFGALWWLIDPLVLMGVYVFFVDVILRRGGENYALFVLVGLLSWKHLSSGVTAAITGTLAREQAMRQVAFPRSAVPVAAVLGETVHFVIGLGVFLAVGIGFGVYPSPIAPLVFLLLVIQVALVLGLSLALAALNIFFRDIQNLTGYAMRLALFLSPILYTVSSIPERFRFIYELNPFATLVPAYRSLLLYEEVPRLEPLATVAVASLVGLIAGFLVFARLARAFAKVA